MTRRIEDLNGDCWSLGQAPSGAGPAQASWEELARIAEWLPATVPGNVRADLIRAGHLSELFYGRRADVSQWVEEHCWWIQREFTLRFATDERVHLLLRGVDYVAEIFLNGRHLGRHEGMFSPLVYEITDLLQPRNQLAVRITGSSWLPDDRSSPWIRLLNTVEARISGLADRFPQRRDTLKCQMGFGWDFAPPLRTMGIWDDVHAVASRRVFIQDARVRQSVAEGQVRLSIDVMLDAASDGAIQLHCALRGESFQGGRVATIQPVELRPGQNRCSIELIVDHPRLWWPWDHGHPDLYRVVIEAWQGEHRLDSFSQTLGLRQVEFDDWTLRVNGHRVYCRGANWVPAHVLPGLVSEADYLALLSLARQANMNMLRVWGGGLREKQAFYDLCDRIGILVWQEFPLACAFLTRFSRSSAFLQLVEAEAQAIVRDLDHHASVVLWCGGNEFSPAGNAQLVQTLQQVVTREDPSRPFLPASPANGDSHNWKVWHEFESPSTYRTDLALFASEFGLQAPPDEATLRRFIPSEELWPPGSSWVFHGAGLEKLWHYARPFLHGREVDLGSFIQATQYAQAQGLQMAIEHYRRRKAQGCGGALIWQLNEPWPAISWSLVDFFRQTKPAYEVVQRLFSPLLVSLDFPPGSVREGKQLPIDVWIVNDRMQSVGSCELEVVLLESEGQPLHRFTQVVNVDPDSAQCVGQVTWILPPATGWRLTAHLQCRGQTLAWNEYDLTVIDDIQPQLRQRLRNWLRGLVLPS